FGDNFQKWGTSTILIESGGWKDDPERQFIRKLNFIALLSAFKSIAEESYKETSTDVYESIPFNDNYIFDLILRNLTLKSGKQKIKIDVGINLDEYEVPNEKTIYYKSRVEDLGDLSTYFGYNDYDFSGYTIEQASVYDKKVFALNDLQDYDFTDLYSKGFSTVLVKKLPEEKYSKFPINLALKSKIDTTINIGEPANFILKNDGKISYIIINGFLQKIEKNRKFEGNGMIIR
ncbi:MAG: peptidase M14, partial [Ignavibacteriota bacterium]